MHSPLKGLSLLRSDSPLTSSGISNGKKKPMKSELKKDEKKNELNNQPPEEASFIFFFPSPSAKNAGNPGFIFLRLKFMMMSCVWLSRVVFRLGE